MRPWRLLLDEPGGGAGAMARDEALLGGAGRGGSPTLRLYRWSPPALSLGAHQDVTHIDLHACRRLGIDVVRRPTGGGAVLHDRELTYSVTARLGEDAFPSSVLGVYDRIAAALVEGLRVIGVAGSARRLSSRAPGPVSCFARASAREIVVGGRKLIGSAQLRRRGAFLQHGSILLGFDPGRLGEILRAPAGTEPVPIASGTEPDSAPATLDALLGRKIPADELAGALAEGFRRALGARLEASSLDPGEAEDAEQLRAFKYLDARWTLEGKVREDRSSGPAPG